MTKKNEGDELDALLNGVEAPDGVLANEVLQTLSDEEAADQGAPAPPEIDKQAIYEAQGSGLGVADDDSAAPKKGKRKKAKGSAPAAKSAKVKAKQEDTDKIVLSRSAALSKKAQVDDLTKLGIKAKDIPAILEAMDGAPKKVSEKAYNLLRYTLGREHLSNYTRFALEQLAHAGSDGMTVPDLVKAMETRYKSGTARSQSQQMSRLFGIFGMATRDGKAIKLDTPAPLVKAACDRLALSVA